MMSFSSAASANCAPGPSAACAGSPLTASMNHYLPSPPPCPSDRPSLLSLLLSPSIRSIHLP
eukprot:7450986-Pyramimonas_sp.AAC.1